MKVVKGATGLADELLGDTKTPTTQWAVGRSGKTIVGMTQADYDRLVKDQRFDAVNAGRGRLNTLDKNIQGMASADAPFNPDFFTSANYADVTAKVVQPDSSRAGFSTQGLVPTAYNDWAPTAAIKAQERTANASLDLGGENTPTVIAGGTDLIAAEATKKNPRKARLQGTDLATSLGVV